MSQQETVSQIPCPYCGTPLSQSACGKYQCSGCKAKIKKGRDPKDTEFYQTNSRNHRPNKGHK